MTKKIPTPNWQRLQLVDFGNPKAATRPGLSVARKKNQAETAQEQTRNFSKGYEDGLSAGRKEGFAAGQAAGAAEGREAADQLLMLATKLDLTLAMFDQEIAEEVLALSLEIARQVLRQAVATQPETVIAVVREALDKIPHLHATIRLHPDDATLLRKYSGDQISHAGHRIQDDISLQRSDVIIEAGGAQVDATLSTRWRRVLETIGSKIPWIDNVQP